MIWWNQSAAKLEGMIDGTDDLIVWEEDDWRIRWAAKFVRLGFANVAPGHNTVGFYIYLALGCHRVKNKLEGSEADMITVKMSEDEVRNAISSGRVIDGPTIAAFCLYLLNK